MSHAEIYGIVRVGIAKLLGFWLQSDMDAGNQVEYITHICNQRLYLLNQVRKQGLPQAQLFNVFFFKQLSCPVFTIRPLTGMDITRIHYASTAWYGYDPYSLRVHCLVWICPVFTMRPLPGMDMSRIHYASTAWYGYVPYSLCVHCLVWI